VNIPFLEKNWYQKNIDDDLKLIVCNWSKSQIKEKCRICRDCIKKAKDILKEKFKRTKWIRPTKVTVTYAFESEKLKLLFDYVQISVDDTVVIS
jgi:hypothetical protein